MVKIFTNIEFGTRKLFFILFTITLLIALFIPHLFTRGMFLDGVTYATISRNLAIGLGSFWEPFYTETLYKSFYEHPPLVFAIQSVFFKFFGDSYIVERVYSLFSLFITLYIMIKIWFLVNKKIFNRTENGWFPVLLFIFSPVISWSYRNNMLENTMGIFTIFSIYLQLNALLYRRRLRIKFIIAGMLIVFAFLCKGVVGFFPIIMPFIYFLTMKDITFSQLFRYSFFLIGPVVATAFVLYQYPPAFKFFNIYLDNQLFQSIQGHREVVTMFLGRFYILYRIIMEILPMFIFCIIFYAINYFKKVEMGFHNNKKFALLFLFIGLSASAPIAISIKQSNFYLVPSIPYYALSMAIYFFPAMESTINPRLTQSNKKKTAVINFSLLVLAVMVVLFSFLQYGKIGRDKDFLRDLEILSPDLERNSKISVCEGMEKAWGAHAYLYRFFQISISNQKNQNQFLVSKGCKFNGTGYTKIRKKTNKIDLWGKNNL